MGFIKRIFCKINHFIVYLICHLLVDSVFDAAGNSLRLVSVDKSLTLLLHHRRFFLGHGPAEKVASSQGVAPQGPHDLHHLLLVDDTPVGGFQDGRKLRAVVRNRIRVVFPADILGDEIHGAGAVKGNSRNDILKTLRLQFLHEVFHARAFQLENAVRFSRSQGRVHCRIVVLHGFQADAFPAALFRHPQGVLDHGERPKPQEIHFQKPQLLQGSHRKLGGNRSVPGS